MNDHMQAAMAEATRLTRARQLAEATALIQRTLGSMSAPVGRSTRADVPNEAVVRVVEVSPPLLDPTIHGGVGASPGPASAWPAVGLQTPSSDTLQRADSLHGSTRRAQQLWPDVVSHSSHPRGKFVDGAYRNTAGTRTYKLYIPRSYTGQAVPLVMMLHGCTQNAVDFAAGTRMNVFAEGKTLLVVYPEQVSSANNSKCWNWFQPADQQRDMGEPSLMAGITQQIMNSYHVDSNRVYVAGMSAGGAMAVIMAATYPDLYAAVGVHSGLAYGAAHDVRSGFAAMRRGAGQSARQLTTVIPLIAFHGDRDTTVSPVNADHLLDQWLQAMNNEQGGSVSSVKVERGQVPRGRAYTRSLYHDASGHAIVEKWLVHQAGHVWSGGSADGSFTDPLGPNASTELLRFFAEHSRKR
ncbi:MAG TPA: PHB depolymerase family esterase [Ktedonobacteraceae bacterium]